jgi:hypothetical protein
MILTIAVIILGLVTKKVSARSRPCATARPTPTGLPRRLPRRDREYGGALPILAFEVQL